MPNSEHLLSIPISDLRIGMFLVKLDIPWIDSPFVRHSRLIKSQEEINKLIAAKVNVLVIDLNKGIGPTKESENTTPPLTNEPTETHSHSETESDDVTIDSASSSHTDEISESEVIEPSLSKSSTSLSEEMSQAKALRNKVREIMGSVMDNLEKELPINQEELTPLVGDTLASIERNNQALLKLAHLSRKTQKLADHAFSTFCLSLNLAASLNLPKEEQHTLGLSALLHEAGWAQLPQQLMGKRTPYSESELKLVKAHIAIGLKILKSSELPSQVIRIITEHHEHPDGTGYPQKLKVDQLDPLTLLFSVVDRYDEMVHQLTDKPGMVPTNALRTLYVEADSGKYDKKAVTALIASLGIYPVTSAVVLNTGEKAKVLEVFPDAHLQPILEIHYDAQGKLLQEPLKVNLREQREGETARTIASVLDPNNAIDDPSRRLQEEED